MSIVSVAEHRSGFNPLALNRRQREDRAMDSRVALDADVLRLLVTVLNWHGGPEPDAEPVSAVRIYFYITNPLITPTVVEELEQASEPALFNWRNCQFEEIAQEDALRRVRERHGGSVFGLPSRPTRLPRCG